MGPGLASWSLSHFPSAPVPAVRLFHSSEGLRASHAGPSLPLGLGPGLTSPRPPGGLGVQIDGTAALAGAVTSSLDVSPAPTCWLPGRCLPGERARPIGLTWPSQGHPGPAFEESELERGGLKRGCPPVRGQGRGQGTRDGGEDASWGPDASLPVPPGDSGARGELRAVYVVRAVPGVTGPSLRLVCPAQRVSAPGGPPVRGGQSRLLSASGLPGRGAVGLAVARGRLSGGKATGLPPAQGPRRPSSRLPHAQPLPPLPAAARGRMPASGRTSPSASPPTCRSVCS